MGIFVEILVRAPMEQPWADSQRPELHERINSRHLMPVLSLLFAASLAAQQQIVDPDFKAVVERPAYPQGGPTIAIDEAHSNFHTADGQYAPFAALLRSDGYRVIASTRVFEKGALSGNAVLVVANARNLPALLKRDLTSPAFTENECDAVLEWVRDGGSLLLIADHAPFGQAADNLAKRFGVAMGKGWAFDRASGGGITTQLIFSRDNGLLGAHPIINGRNASEAVIRIQSFTGQSLTVPAGASILLKLGAAAREAATTESLDAEDVAVRAVDASKDTFGSHSRPVGGDAQGLAMRFGKGRVVVLGEAALFTAQILRFTEGNRQRDQKFGMNVSGNDDRQFALNVLHWLTGLLD